MSVAVYIPNDFDDATWIRYAAFLRLLRLFRLVRVLQLPSMLRFLYVMISLEHIRVFYQMFLAMLPAATRLLKVRAPHNRTATEALHHFVAAYLTCYIATL
jgi:hypothetical protein